MDPSDGFKVNFDGVIFLENKAFGVGIIIRDELGQFVAAISKNFQLTGTPQYVELLASWEAIQFAKHLKVL